MSVRPPSSVVHCPSLVVVMHLQIQASIRTLREIEGQVHRPETPLEGCMSSNANQVMV